MIIIGERINSSRAKIKEAIEKRDALFLVSEARRQVEAGATFLDVNCATAEGNEEENICWAIEAVQKEVSAPFSIDSPSAKAIAAALSVNKNGKPFINSVTAEERSAREILALAKKFNTNVVALTMDDSGMPQTADERVKLAEKILNMTRTYKISDENIYFDPLVKPISSEQNQANEFLSALRLIKKMGSAKTVGGLSNVSFGLPQRKLLNKTFLSMAIANGIDAVIIDPLDKESMATLSAAVALLGQDDYCMNYITKFREGKLAI